MRERQPAQGRGAERGADRGGAAPPGLAGEAGGLIRRAAPLAAFLLLGAGHPARADCPEGLRATTVVELLLGRNVGERLGVTRPAFRRFVAEEVAPRFPSGFTVVETLGAWRDPATGRTLREPGWMLVVALEDAARDLPRAREVAEAYRARFRQTSVGVMARAACAAF